MNRPEVIIFSLLLLGWLIGISWCHNATCPDCQTATTKAAVLPVESNPDALAIAISDAEHDFSAKTTDNLLFGNGACEYETPLSENLQTVFRQTATYLQNSSNRILVLKGLHEGAENNSCTDASDLGIARAEQVKQLLVQMGAPTNQIEITSSEIRDLLEYNNLLIGGVDYQFMDLAVPALTEAEALRAENITLYFATNKQEINLTAEQSRYFERLKSYLAQNTDARAKVTGHTDDQGDDRINIRLSRKRSEFVRDYMIEQGIPKQQITNKGLGPDYPIASNSTGEGRALNRRVEITLE